jgi:hypothetical protein
MAQWNGYVLAAYGATILALGGYALYLWRSLATVGAAAEPPLEEAEEE